MCYRKLLDEAIDACENIRKYFYQILIGKNKKQININLFFNKKSFFHLLGLHYLRDVFEFNHHPNAERIYSDLVKNKKKLREKASNSQFANDVCSRWEALKKLEYILDNNLETYYDKENYYGGRMNNIDFDYVFDFRNDDGLILSFYFLKGKDDEKYIMVSTFEDKEPNSHCRRAFTLIKKNKVEIKNNRNIELFNIDSDNSKTD